MGWLYNQMALTETLFQAWNKVVSNDGMAGYDRQSITDYSWRIEEHLAALSRQLLTGTYEPQPLLKLVMLKPSGKPRNLLIPTVMDRVAETAAAIVLTPLVESELGANTFAYRQGLSRMTAAHEIERLRNLGYNWVVDADISNFFDTVDHQLLFQRFHELCDDDELLNLIKRWLTVEIVDGHNPREKNTAGLPQGCPISPMLANLYLDKFDERMEKEGFKLVRFADDCAPRRRTGGRKSSVQPSCTRDEGGPFGVAVQAETSNHLLLLHLRDVVVSESGKGRARPCQIRTVESNANEPLMTCRKRRNDVKTGRESLTRDKSGSNLLTGQTASGIKAARTRFRLLCGTWEPVTPMLREKHKERSSKCQSTDAGYRGGVTCNSDEGSVMELERRGYPIQSETCEQPAMGGFA